MPSLPSERLLVRRCNGRQTLEPLYGRLMKWWPWRIRRYLSGRRACLLGQAKPVAQYWRCPGRVFGSGSEFWRGRIGNAANLGPDLLGISETV